MMRSIALLVLLLSLTAALQVSLFPRLAVHGVQPDLLLVCVIVAGLLYGPPIGATVGFVAGWFTFALQGALPGSFLASRIAMGYLSGLLESRLFKENIQIHIGAVFLGSMLATGLFLLIDPDLIRQPDWPQTALYTALYNTAFSPLAYFLLSRLPLSLEKE
jgi:rod shape-determining protein MreD